MTTEAQKRALKRYAEKNKQYTKTFVFRLDRRTEGDVIKAVEAKTNRKRYFVDCVRRDIEKGER